ncbi:MAG: hypothetical protein ACR650_02270, partial [Methylocystis sp.]
MLENKARFHEFATAANLPTSAGFVISSAADLSGLGSVGNRDSSFQLVMIQALDEPIRFDRRPMGEDGAALSWQGERSRP